MRTRRSFAEGSATAGYGSGMPAVCVYCAARHGAKESYTSAARHVGATFAGRGWDLVYGGGRVGLMGEVADAALAGGSHVTGVITTHLLGLEVGHDAVSELVVVADMAERKREMFQRSDAFVILPGGIGTLEELFEIWCWSSLGLHAKPLVLVNVDGYFDQLVGFLRHSIDVGLFTDPGLDLATVVVSAHEAAEVISAAFADESNHSAGGRPP